MDDANFSLLGEYWNKNELAKQAKKHPRTIDRWVALGEAPPHVTLGRDMLFHIPTARQWLLSRLSVGPSKRAASREQQ